MTNKTPKDIFQECQARDKADAELQKKWASMTEEEKITYLRKANADAETAFHKKWATMSVTEKEAHIVKEHALVTRWTNESTGENIPALSAEEIKKEREYFDRTVAQGIFVFSGSKPPKNGI